MSSTKKRSCQIDDKKKSNKVYRLLSEAKTIQASLCEAVFCNVKDDVKLLLKNQYVDPANNHNYMIREACTRGLVHTVTCLLADPRVDPTAMNNSALLNAIRGGHVKTVKLLLADPRVDPTTVKGPLLSHDKIYALVCAINGGHAEPNIGGHVEIVKLLLDDKRVDPSMNQNFAFLEAVEGGNEDIVKMVISDARVDPNMSNNLAIRVAAGAGSLNSMKILLADPRMDPSAFIPENINEVITKVIRWGKKESKKEIVRILFDDPRVDQSGEFKLLLLTKNPYLRQWFD